MALLESVPAEPDDGRLRELFAADAETYGRPPLFARMLAHDPDVLAARQAYVAALGRAGDLDELEVELAYVAVSAANECPYCVASHRERLVEHVGVPDEQVDAVLAGDDAPFSERERAIIDVARMAADDPKRVDDGHLERLGDCGFDDAGVVALVVAVGAAVSANVIADCLNVHPEDREGLDGNGVEPGGE